MNRVWTCICLLMVFCPIAYADVPRNAAIRVIVSEAADQDLKGMVCVGEVLRRRGSIKGFYGYRTNRPDKQPKAVWDMAAQAWDISANTNYTKGADHFENVRAFGEPWWAKYCVRTLVYKDHVFYKETRPRTIVKKD